MTETQLAALRLALEINEQLLRETPALYKVIEEAVRAYVKETWGLDL